MKKTITYLFEKKAKGEKMPRTTLYDYPMACIAEEAGIDIINVGDSISMVTLGYENTLGARLEIMLEHAKAVRKGAPTAFIMGDMPFGSYQVSETEAVRNATKYIQEANMDCIKIEGGAEIVPLIERLTKASIPVIAHTGLTPQSINILGGYKTRGRNAQSAFQVIRNALDFEKAGAVAVVIEAIPQEVAKIIYEKLVIPLLGTGIGPYSDSPMINIYDLLGFSSRTPRFAKKYADLKNLAISATKEFVNDVITKAYPAPEHCYKMQANEYEQLITLLEKNQLDTYSK